jgi:hypothetical protein
MLPISTMRRSLTPVKCTTVTTKKSVKRKLVGRRGRINHVVRKQTPTLLRCHPYLGFMQVCLALDQPIKQLLCQRDFIRRQLLFRIGRLPQACTPPILDLVDMPIDAMDRPLLHHHPQVRGRLQLINTSSLLTRHSANFLIGLSCNLIMSCPGRNVF